MQSKSHARLEISLIKKLSRALYSQQNKGVIRLTQGYIHVFGTDQMSSPRYGLGVRHPSLILELLPRRPSGLAPLSRARSWRKALLPRSYGRKSCGIYARWRFTLHWSFWCLLNYRQSYRPSVCSLLNSPFSVRVKVGNSVKSSGTWGRVNSCEIKLHFHRCAFHSLVQ